MVLIQVREHVSEVAKDVASIEHDVILVSDLIDTHNSSFVTARCTYDIEVREEAIGLVSNIVCICSDGHHGIKLLGAGKWRLGTLQSNIWK